MSNDLYFQMLRIRMIEEEISKRYPEGKMRCPVHLSVGQEAPAVGLCAALTHQDKVVSTHRGHAHYLAKGGSLKGLIAELHGKRSGCSRGMGGSMHLIDLSVNFWGSTSIVGGTIPYGVGLAFADKLRGNNNRTVICIGDAAVEEGVFHESANFASLHKLNVIFFLENNQYSCFTHLKDRQPSRPFEHIAKAHGLPCFYADGSDPSDIRGACWNGPITSMVVVNTWRHYEHCGPNIDDHLGYRDIKPKQIFPVDVEWIPKIKAEIDEAFAFAESSELAEMVSPYAD